MKSIPDKAVDLVLTDPPYNVGLDYGDKVDDERTDYGEWVESWFSECKRVSKILLVTPGVANVTLYPKPLWMGCWFKHGSPSRCPTGFNAWEPILIYGKRIGEQTTDVFDAILESDDKALGHPCPKPVVLFRQIIELYSEPGDIVLDPFLGSGTTLLACRKTGRIGLGFEINPDYESIIRERSMQDVSKIDEWGIA